MATEFSHFQDSYHSQDRAIQLACSQFRNGRRSILATRAQLASCGLSAKDINEFLLKAMRIPAEASHA